MSIKLTHKLADYGQQLSFLEEKGGRTLQDLQLLREQLPQLRAQVSVDADLSQAERTQALAEVDAVITQLVQDIKTFALNLG